MRQIQHSRGRGAKETRKVVEGTFYWLSLPPGVGLSLCKLPAYLNRMTCPCLFGGRQDHHVSDVEGYINVTWLFSNQDFSFSFSTAIKYAMMMLNFQKWNEMSCC